MLHTHQVLLERRKSLVSPGAPAERSGACEGFSAFASGRKDAEPPWGIVSFGSDVSQLQPNRECLGSSQVPGRWKPWVNVRVCFC